MADKKKEGRNVVAETFNDTLEEVFRNVALIDTKENVPAIMGRIVHLERFVCCLKIKKEQEWKIRLTDSLVPENNGYFIIKTGIEGGSLIRVENLSEKEKKMFCSMDIGQLTEELFRLPVFLNEVV